MSKCCVYFAVIINVVHYHLPDLRNKIFHGELPDFSFNFSQGTQDDKRLDKINLLLEDLNYELLLDFNAL